jgi:hypothetical protein
MLKAAIIALGLTTAPSSFTIDYGGNVLERLQQMHYLKMSGQEFRIEGVCISACTMFLGLPKVCVAEDTIFGFHSAASFDGEKWEKSEWGNAIALDVYPLRIREFVTKNNFLKSLDLSFVNAETMWALGIKKCDEVKVQ